MPGIAYPPRRTVSSGRETVQWGIMTLDMPRISAGVGTSLLILGVGAYFASGQASPTALIPAPFGIALVALGLIARKASSTKHAMHAAAVLALVGFAGSANGLPDLFRLLAGGAVERPLAAVAKSLMALVLASFLVLCIQSFRQARKARQ